MLSQVVGPATSHLVMAHLSEDCNRPELVETAVHQSLVALQRTDIKVMVARQDTVCETIVV